MYYLYVSYVILFTAFFWVLESLSSTWVSDKTKSFILFLSAAVSGLETFYTTDDTSLVYASCYLWFVYGSDGSLYKTENYSYSKLLV